MTVPDVRSRRRFWIGVLLLVGGLLGHLFAARAIGGSYVAYRDPIFGFVLLSLVSGALIAGMGWRFCRREHDIKLLFLTLIQAPLCVAVYHATLRPVSTSHL